MVEFLIQYFNIHVEEFRSPRTLSGGFFDPCFCILRIVEVDWARYVVDAHGYLWSHLYVARFRSVAKVLVLEGASFTSLPEVELLRTVDGGCEPFVVLVMACDLGSLLGQSFDGKRLGCVVDTVAQPIREGV